MLAYNYNFYLLLTWLPGYLNATMGLDVLHAGLYTTVPWVAATAADLVVGGWLVDHLIRRGYDASRAIWSELRVRLSARFWWRLRFWSGEFCRIFFYSVKSKPFRHRR
jgi:hypothetical protein